MSDKNAVSPAGPDRKILIQQDPSKSEFRQFADVSLSPVVHAADTTKRWAEKSFGDIGINEAIAVVREETGKAALGDLEAAKRMLMAQAMTLDAIFNDMAKRASHVVKDKEGGVWSISADTFETVTRVAFKAQSQCRSTLQTLGELVNPRSVAFIKQANLANGPQQVNNGAGPNTTHAPAHAEKTEVPANELLEATPSERLDFGAPATASGANQNLAAVGAVHGAEDAGGTVRRARQRPKARAA